MSTDTRDRSVDAGATDAAGRRGSALLAVARFEGRNRVRVTGVIAALFALYGGMFVALGPQLVAGDAITEMLEALPPLMKELLGLESLASVEGLLASEFYTFGWLVGFGGYLAYTAAGSVAGDLRDDRMDTLLAGPVPRRDVLLGKYVALFVPVVALSVFVPSFLYAASVLVDAPIALFDLAVLHVLAVPYLLAWGAVGLTLGVVVRHGRTAGRLALGLVFFAWMFESVIATTDYDQVGAVSPMRYLDPPAVLVHGTYDWVGAGVLLGVAVVLVAASTLAFQRSDL